MIVSCGGFTRHVIRHPIIIRHSVVREDKLPSQGIRMIQINHQRRFSQQSDYSGFASIRVHNSQLAALGGRNAWVSITSGSATVYRTIRGSGSLPGFPQDGMELDYDTFVELGVPSGQAPSLVLGGGDRPFFPCNLKARSIGRYELIRAHWAHPNPAYRVPLQISIVLGSVGVALGAIGVILGIISVM